LLEAVRAIAELSSEGSAEVRDRVDQARSMIESLPEPIGVTVVAQRLTIDGNPPAAETFISAPTGSIPARCERALNERPTRARSCGR
jgi:hypothetical protein